MIQKRVNFVFSVNLELCTKQQRNVGGAERTDETNPKTFSYFLSYSLRIASQWRPSEPVIVVELVHVIQEVVGGQLLILVAREEHFQDQCPVKAHPFKLRMKDVMG